MQAARENAPLMLFPVWTNFIRGSGVQSMLRFVRTCDAITLHGGAGICADWRG